MPRKRIPSPRPTRAERPAEGVRERRTFTPAEVRAQRLWVEQLYVQGIDERRIAPLAERPADQGGLGYPISAQRVRSIVVWLKEEWARVDSEGLGMRKARQLRRVVSHMQKAQAKGNWNAVAQFEKLAAEIGGTLAPIQVNVDMRVQGAIANVLAELTPEELADLVDEQRHIEDKARRLDALPAHVIEAEAVEVPAAPAATKVR